MSPSLTYTLGVDRLLRLCRTAALALAGLAAALLVAAGASVARTEWLRASFERQFWTSARYPNAELLGAWSGMGRLVASGAGGAFSGTSSSGPHCDFAAQAVYGTADDLEQVEAYYAGRRVTVGGSEPVGLEVRPISDRALHGDPLRPGDADEAMSDLLRRTGTDLARARTFPTVYAVEAISWGHGAWLDWRCR
jgi:hypothetical protein